MITFREGYNMNRVVRGIGLAIFAVTLLLAISQVATAQREEGRGDRGGPGGRRFAGGFGSPVLRLAANEKVQAALKLSDEQKTKINELEEQFRKDSRKVFDQEDVREGMQKLSEETTAKLTQVLDGDQQKRLQGISIQLMGAGAVMADPALAKDLNVSDEQKAKLRDAQRENMRSMGETFRELRDLSGEERRAKVETLRAEGEKRLLDVLTPEQQEKLNSLKGEKVDIDLAELRGPGRGFEGRGGRGDRGRGERAERGRGDREKGANDSDP
jgi:Spy/CpxP family protein refolding chaperone